MRTHQFDIKKKKSGGGGMPAQLRRVNIIGPFAQLELERDDNGDVLDAM
ncbi:TOBE-like domain-containing protein, partial [Undibacterium sp. CCC1.1]